ncbi:hypothetical protein NBH00_07090 [Paraconexibacter antarcticus]|uniref:ABM domain-containing protein n=1 Tax=Paraconexibacter antarcticus TaxID=2949664 RepID=A0ABY5DWT9_9ACTN|nr:hypothetical protein [Paraconexibacter antarcticus]UTI65965.1 hypothetical protein NBH00_07090 [Paraconexibacter antarcticus]
MLARVTAWEGGSADALRAAAAEMQQRAPSGPPEGVVSTGFTMLVEPDAGRALMIGLFASEADLDASEPVLQSMSPPDGVGSMVSKHVYDVGIDVRM